MNKYIKICAIFLFLFCLFLGSLFIYNYFGTRPLLKGTVILKEGLVEGSDSSGTLTMQEMDQAFVDLDTLLVGNSADADIQIFLSYGTDLFSFMRVINGAKILDIGYLPPTAKDCAQHLDVYTSIPLSPRMDKYFCVLTNDGNIVSIRLVKSTPFWEENSFGSELEFEVIVWKNKK